MILLTGVTGTLGRELLRQWPSDGGPLRLLARDPARLPTSARPAEAAIVRGDLGDADDVARALEGVARLFLLTKPAPEQPAMDAMIAERAAAAGVEFVVRVSVLGADPYALSPVRAWHGAAERAVARALPASFLRANYLMQNLLGYARQIGARGVIAAPAGESRLSLIDAADVAAAAIALLTQPGIRPGHWTLTGPEALDFGAIAAEIGGVTGRPCRFEDLGEAEFRAKLVNGGQPTWYAEAITALWADFRGGLNAAVSADASALLGRSPIPLREFARRHQDRWQGPPTRAA